MAAQSATAIDQRVVGALRSSARWAIVPVTIVVLVSVAAVRVLHLANADAVLPGLFSTEHMTWFYWGQNRLGNVVPALALPIQDLRWNISAQLFLIGLGWFALAAMFAANHLARTGRAVEPWHVAIVTAAAGVATWIALPAPMEQVLVFEQLYAFALALFLAGLLATCRCGLIGRSLGGLALFAATIINPSLVLYTPIVLVLPGVDSSRRRGSRVLPTARVVVPIALAALSFVATSLISGAFGQEPANGPSYNRFSLNEMVGNVDTAFGNVGASTRTGGALLTTLAALIWLAVRWRTIERRLQLTYSGAVAFALLWVLVFSGNAWVVANEMYPRYFFPIYAAWLLLIVAALAEGLSILVARWESSRPPSCPTSSVVLAICGLFAAPIAGVAVLRHTQIDALASAQDGVPTIRDYDVDVVVGNYWVTWPLVIEARSAGLDVLGVAERTSAIASIVERRISVDLAQERVVALCVDGDVGTCVAAVSEFAPQPLVAMGTASESPLVIELGPVA